jgi:hypothetical protein
LDSPFFFFPRRRPSPPRLFAFDFRTSSGVALSSFETTASFQRARGGAFLCCVKKTMHQRKKQVPLGGVRALSHSLSHSLGAKNKNQTSPPHL